MAINENGSLQALEQLMEEFFNPSTSNTRKHEIEQQLDVFKSDPQLWNLCVYFITHTSSQYVTMFALTTLESMICQQWATNDWSYRDGLKNVLYNYLIEKGNQAPHFLRGKYAKLLVEIAKKDWPQRYPNFLINILELLKTEPNQLIGLVLLRTTGEEFMGGHAVLENGRKEEISRLLQPYIPVFFEILTSILENLGRKPRHSATATPPPSPTHPSSTPDLPQQLATATFKADNKALNKEALNTVQQLFMWVPINLIPPQIIRSIFNFTNISSYAQDDDDICVLAMSTINELLYRKCIPPGSQDFFIHLYYFTVELLRDLSTSNRIETLDSLFVEKLSELLVLLIEQHFWRVEMEPSFSAIEFLSLLFQLTVQLPSVQCYLRCLTAWAAFIKQIKPQNTHLYSEAFLGLVTTLLGKIQFTSNFNQLKSINNSDTDENNETEWSIFIKASNEVIAMIAEYSPLATFNQVLLSWKSCYDVYKRLETSANNCDYFLNFNNSETERMCYIIRDFSTLTKTLARLSSLFIDQDKKDFANSAAPIVNNLIEKLIESASISTNLRFYNLKFRENKLRESFIEIHSELLAALKTWLIWISQNGKMNNQNLKIISEICLPLITDIRSLPSKVSHSSAHVILTLTNLVFPTNLMILPAFNQFVQLAPSLPLDSDTTHVIHSSVCNLLLKSWGDINQQDATQRNYLIGVFIDTLTLDFRKLSTNSDVARVRDVSQKVLISLSHIIDCCKDFPIASKKLLCMAVKTTVDCALYLFPTYAKDAEISSYILMFFLKVLGVLQHQMGVEGIKSAINVFLQVAVSEQNSRNLSNIEKLLQILQLVVESPSSSYKNLLPDILQLCMGSIYPLVLSNWNEYPEAFIALLTLLYSVLLHRWQYFYMSQVKSGYSPCCSEESNIDTPQKPEQLLAVLQVFGEALLQQDINIFRLSLGALEDLNSKWKLYHKVLFKEHLLLKFLAVLLQALLEKTQVLFSEDIQVAIYNMASVNFEMFFSTFLQQFLSNCEGITPQECDILINNFVHNYDKDMPTFVQHLQIFVGDAQHFKLCNRRPICVFGH